VSAAVVVGVAVGVVAAGFADVVVVVGVAGVVTGVVAAGAVCALATGRASANVALTHAPTRMARADLDMLLSYDERRRRNLPLTGVGSRLHTRQEVSMSRLIRMDQTGHTILAEWGIADGADGAGYRAAVDAFNSELGQGYFAVASNGDGQAEQVRELPVDASLVILRRPIAGG
jgi:hypothetical protein